MSKKSKIITAIIVAIVVILGGGYFYASHSVASKVPGHVYEYTSVSGNNKVYMAFSKNSDQAIVTPEKSKAIQANNSQQDFDNVYKSTSKNGSWQYLAKGSHLTLTKTQKGKLSTWQYNRVLSLGSKLHSGSFTYQIANAGQGVDHKGTTFVRVK